jgi:hypothetical protein
LHVVEQGGEVLARRLTERDRRTAIVTTPEGVLIGVAGREDLAERRG